MLVKKAVILPILSRGLSYILSLTDHTHHHPPPIHPLDVVTSLDPKPVKYSAAVNAAVREVLPAFSTCLLTLCIDPAKYEHQLQEKSPMASLVCTSNRSLYSKSRSLTLQQHHKTILWHQMSIAAKYDSTGFSRT